MRKIFILHIFQGKVAFDINLFRNEYLISPLVFIEVHVVLSFVSPYFM